MIPASRREASDGEANEWTGWEQGSHEQARGVGGIEGAAQSEVEQGGEDGGGLGADAAAEPPEEEVNRDRGGAS